MNQVSCEAAQTVNLVIIGCGKLATALLVGLLRFQSETRATWRLNVIGTVQSKLSQKRLENLLRDLETDAAISERACKVSFQTEDPNFEAVSTADIVILGCKPSAYAAICHDLRFRTALGASPGKLLVSLVGGTSCHQIRRAFYGEVSVPLRHSITIARAIPNIAAQIRQSVTTLSIIEGQGNTAGVEEAKTRITKVFSAVGTVFWIPEEAMAVTSTIGASALALFATVIDQVSASANANTNAISPAVIREITAQAAYGTAGLTLHGLLPRDIVDQVATRGGSTRAGLNILDEHKTPQSIDAAIKATIEATRGLSGTISQTEPQSGTNGSAGLHSI